MRTCPKCKKKTLVSKREMMKVIEPQSAGDSLNHNYIRTLDEWSLMSAKCFNPKCGYFR